MSCEKSQHGFFFSRKQDLTVNATHLLENQWTPRKRASVWNPACLLYPCRRAESVCSVSVEPGNASGGWLGHYRWTRKKVCFLTLVNQVNGPLGSRSRVPNGLIREEEVDYRNEHEGEGHWLTHLCLPPSVFLLPRTHKSHGNLSSLMCSTSQTSPLALQEHWLKCWFSFLVWKPISGPTGSCFTILYWL